MLKRILSAVPIIIVVALAAIFQSWVMVALAVALALATQFEIVRAFDRNGKPVTAYLSYAFAVVLAAFFAGFFILLQNVRHQLIYLTGSCMPDQDPLPGMLG